MRDGLIGGLLAEHAHDLADDFGIRWVFFVWVGGPALSGQGFRFFIHIHFPLPVGGQQQFMIEALIKIACVIRTSG